METAGKRVCPQTLSLTGRFGEPHHVAPLSLEVNFVAAKSNLCLTTTWGRKRGCCCNFHNSIAIKKTLCSPTRHRGRVSFAGLTSYSDVM